MDTEHDPAPEGLWATKLLSAQRAAQDIKPTKKHFDGYPYAPIDEVVRRLKECLNTAGLVVQTGAEDFEEFETTTSKGKPQWMSTVRMVFYVTDSGTGYTRQYPFLGRGLNEKDKGITHAIQSGKKLFLQSLLLVEVSEDAPDPDAGKDGKDGKEPIELIPEAQGIEFDRLKSRDVIRKDTGDVVRLCSSTAVHGNGWPMIRVPAGGNRWLCIHAACGHVEAHDPEKPIDKNGGAPKTGREGAREDKAADDYRMASERLLKKHGVLEWEWDAILQYMDYPPDVDAWGAKRWQTLHERLQSPTRLLNEALAHCAEELPADEQRIEYLRSLYTDANLDFQERTEAEAAIKCHWHDAVEHVIRKFEGKVDAPGLALTAGGSDG